MQPMSVGIMLGVGDDPDTSLEKVKTIGVDNVQLGCPPDQYFTPDARDKLKQSIAASGITITTVFCGFAGESYADIPTVKRTVGYVPADSRTERIEKTKRISDFAKNLGVDQIAAHAGFIAENHNRPALCGDGEYNSRNCRLCERKRAEFFARNRARNRTGSTKFF